MTSFLSHGSLIKAAQIVTFFIALGFVGPVYAQDCKLKSRLEILNLVKTSHPQLALKQNELEILDANIKKASQVPNPQLNFTTNHGERNSIGSSETTGSLQYVFELGSKRKSRVKLAESQFELGQVELNIEAEKTLIDIALKISRQSQLRSMLDLYKESLNVFSKVRSTLRKNKKLSPEHQIQEDMVDMEVSKHRIIISRLASELSYLNKSLQFYTGKNCQIVIKDNEFSFPEPKVTDADQIKTPKLKIAQMESNLRNMELSLAKSEAYPDLKIGPSMQLERGMGNDVDRFGVSLTLDLPILNRNSGGKNIAKRRVSLFNEQLRFEEKENNLMFKSLVSSYKTVIETLRAVPKKKTLLKKHHKIEKFFLRGLISIPTMIDGHDELLSLIEERDKHELLALQMFLKISQSKNDLNSALILWSQK